MIRPLAALLALAAPGTAPAADTRMTLAEANRLSPAELGKRLLGAVGESRGFVEKRVWANGGAIVFQPGLNAIDLYEKPHSAGFDGLCEVDGISIQFEASPPRTPGDPPHAVHSFFPLKRFVALRAPGGFSEEADWKELDRACARLTPVADRKDPVLFAVWHESSNPAIEASFAMRAVAKAKTAAPGLAGSIRCTPDRSDPHDSTCADPVATVAGFPAGRITLVDVHRCPDRLDRYCVRAVYPTRVERGEGQEVELTIVTDAPRYDPPKDFAVVAVAVDVRTWVE